MKLKVTAETTYTCDITAAKKWIRKTFAKGHVCEDEPDNMYINTSTEDEHDARDKLLKVVECVENQDWQGFEDAYYNLGRHKGSDYPLAESVPAEVEHVGFVMLRFLKEKKLKECALHGEDPNFKVTTLKTTKLKD